MTWKSCHPLYVKVLAGSTLWRFCDENYFLIKFTVKITPKYVVISPPLDQEHLFILEPIILFQGTQKSLSYMLHVFM